MERTDVVADMAKRLSDGVEKLKISSSTLRDTKVTIPNESVLYLEICRERLDNWTKKWKVDSNRPESFYLKIWGNSGFSAVQDRLLQISMQTSQIATQCSKDTERTGKGDTIGRKKDLQKLLGRNAALKDMLQKKKKEAIPADTSNLGLDIAMLSSRIDELYTISSMAFNSTRRSVPLSLDNSDDTQNSLALFSKNGTAESLDLLPICKSLNGLVFLDMNLLGGTHNITSALSKSHLKFNVSHRAQHNKPWEDSDEYLTTSGTLADKEFVRHDIDMTGRRMCSECKVQLGSLPIAQEALQNMSHTSSKAVLSLQRTEDSSSGHYHCFEVSARGRSAKAPVPLARYLNESHTGQPQLSRSAKINLALQLLQSGFFLLNTPWFSNLNDKTLMVLDNGQYSLEKKPVDLETGVEAGDAITITTSSLFRLGVLLVEIAVGESLDNSSDDLEATPIQKLPSVARNMGVQYRDAAAFCLQRGRVSGWNPGSNMEEDRHFLAEYYKETVFKLENLRKAISGPE
ncbi:hypothetical protein N431DRAFT_472790 [Stipitochalara longipes BDJ]|nr:hypothetical protein N431DRAFT_472790 [Stipitochalara longipes BDJ]